MPNILAASGRSLRVGLRERSWSLLFAEGGRPEAAHVGQAYCLVQVLKHKKES